MSMLIGRYLMTVMAMVIEGRSGISRVVKGRLYVVDLVDLGRWSRGRRGLFWWVLWSFCFFYGMGWRG